MYVFNKITVTPQLPERIKGLSAMAGNFWWSWNTDFLKLFKKIDMDLWDKVDKNPVIYMSLMVLYSVYYFYYFYQKIFLLLY